MKANKLDEHLRDEVEEFARSRRGKNFLDLSTTRPLRGS
uniref:Uncharacterized protein n=1 Tax=Anguilla anguilla TaxID=7936 RepID=A0A0E9QFK9_ANGAN